MDPLTVVVVVVALAAGFGAGWGLKPERDTGAQTTAALAAQAEAIAAVQAGQAKIAEAATRPIVLDAELRSELAQVPVQCRRDAGGDPTTPACAWATCLQYGQSGAQRPECRAVEAVMIDALKGACGSTR